MKHTIATLLSGGEGVGVGARAAGLQHLWGIEIDNAIAQVARDNGFNVITADIFDVDPRALARPDVLHASPECKNASQAKASKGNETALDRAVARRVIEFVEVLKPRIFTLENVWPYRKFKAFKYVLGTLAELGYFVHYDNINAADFGVPQTRKRLILRAVHGGLIPPLPSPEVPWNGWHGAIEDLIPSLPTSQLAPWQLKRLPDALANVALVSQGISRDHKGGEYPLLIRRAKEPAYTVTANSNMNGMRALVGGQYGVPYDGKARPPQVRGGEDPSFTVTATYKGDWRAFIVDGGNAGRAPTVRMEDEPMFTVDAMRPTKHPKRACVHGRVVKMTPRALARFQSFPDSYILPDAQALAGRIIGNAVPPLMYQKIVAQLAEVVL